MFFLKKFIVLLAALSSMIVMTGCQSPTTTEQSSAQSQATTKKVTIILQEEGKELSAKNVTYQPNQTLLELLKKQFSVKEDNGFVTAIDGHAQDKDKGLYWTFTINGKMAEKGANDIKLSPNDQIVFNLATFK
ncbi:DUF4430 domain-containing protein [Enterococcus hirae]|uniref:DUF4430 domain-containing protein n=1 Tax=Enterococcus hirae TaxID=1354 RepID=UPI00211AEF98|nr:DUF4430 domain-containing protein [Enterococcus hirae]